MPGHDIIVVGASAGGIEALREVVGALPADLQAAVFIVVHVPAQSPSILPQILDREGPLSVAHAVDGEPIRPGRVYVAPPDNHLLVEPERVRVVHGPRENRYRPAVDPLFRSAAVAYGPRVAGVVLTGALDDGTVGMIAVKRCGGVAVVQDPHEALYPGMPWNVMRSVRVDYCVRLAEVAPLLVRLSREPAAEGVFEVDEDLMTENRIAEQQVGPDELIESVEKLGKLSTFTCPECGGTLWELHDADLLRFRCHERQSNLGPILERHSKLPVVVVYDRVRLEPGKIYVVPSNRHVKIFDGEVYVEGDHEGRPRPSVDLLLSSAAKSYGEALIAVVLTGSGSDGAAGAVDVKSAGGTVIIQNPESAPYPSMPLSLPPTIVDHVADIEQIADLLTNLLHGVRVVTSEKAEDPLRQLLAHVSRHTNIDFHHYKPTTILRRIARRMAVVRVATLREYQSHLDAHPEEVQELIRAFLIKVTGFFRDPEAYEFIRERVMPELLAMGREQGNVLRLWSAGCATGEEPYSLALLLADALGAELPEWSIKIFATDLDESAINFARRGIYPANVLEDLPDDYLVRYFEPFDQSFRIAKTLRQMVIFGQQDLSRGVPFPRIDLVVCRNLLIYLKPELQQTVLDLFTYSLHQTNGFLFLGKAETARPTKGTFDLVNKKWKIYRCKSGPVTLPQREGGARLPRPAVSEQPNFMRPLAGYEKQMAKPPEANVPDFDITHLRRFNELVLRHLPFGVVVIDRGYRILSVNGYARRVLGIRDIANDQDFLHAVRGLPYAQVRQAIDNVFRERSPVALEAVELEPFAGSDGRFLNLSVMPMYAESGLPELAVVCVSDASDVVRTSRQLEEARAERERLAADLGSANKRLTDVNKELQDANEELQAANEELMLTQEELQATNEEFEATNEELQATNEELETNNEELQATNEELQTTNDELTARTIELQDMTRQLTDEQKRLAEVVELAPYPTLVLRGRAHVIEMYNPRYGKLFGGKQQVGRPLEEVFGGDEPDEFVRLVREAYAQDRATTTPPMPFSTHGPGERAGQVVHTIIPLHDGSDRVDGVVVYTESVAEREGRDDGGAGKGTK